MTTITPTAPAIAFLGTGRMGAPMAANLARGGFAVRVWNRTISRAEALTTDGAVVASSPAQAVRGATIVITMLADGAATEQAATGPDGLLTAGPGTIWVQMATVGAVAVMGSVLNGNLHGAMRTGFVPASQPGWWILAACGTIVLILGITTTGRWARRTAAQTAARLEPAGGTPPARSEVKVP